MRTPAAAVLAVVALIAVSCSSPDGRFRLEGSFKNLNQGEFYLYSHQTGRNDTLHVVGGRFVLERPLRDTTLFTLVFPNYSELPVYAEPGAKVTVKGDVSHLREVRVTGTEANEQMTAFRLKTAAMPPPETRQEARQYVERHPESPICLYLIRRHFVLAPEPDYATARQLCQTALTAQPGNAELAWLAEQTASLALGADTTRLPRFTAVDTRGDTITEKNLKADVNVIFVWASWNYDSHQALRLLNLVQREHERQVCIVGIGLDASERQQKSIMGRDTIKWHNVCTGEMWLTPALAQLGIASLPANIVADKDGKILARNLKPNDLKKKVDSLLE